MRVEDRDPETLTIFDLFVYVVGDDDAAASREHFCDVVGAQLANVSSWIGVDAWLGAGDVAEAERDDASEPDAVRQQAFLAVSLVAQISAELVAGALLLFRAGNEYGSSALVRQLIECEYLLRAFTINFADAARWYEANEQDKWDFTPKNLRKIGGFDHQEYFDHCESGGHPHPSGQKLLSLPRAMNDLHLAASGRPQSLDIIRALWLDLTFHCDRTWRALAEVLASEHARFVKVRAGAIAAVDDARSSWRETDLLADHAGSILQAMKSDPTTLLSDLVDLRDLDAED